MTNRTHNFGGRVHEQWVMLVTKDLFEKNECTVRATDVTRNKEGKIRSLGCQSDF